MYQNKKELIEWLVLNTTFSFLNSNRNLIVCKQIINETNI